MFKKAERRQAKLKLAITGPSGSGKTFSALKLAKGIGGKVAVIDTENGSASLYSESFAFDVLEIAPPFTTEKYLEAIQAAVKAEYDILIIDSITHAWAGEGGLLEQKEQLDARGKGNSYTNWGAITKKHESFKSALLHSDIHIIATMRSKQDYAMAASDQGKQSVQKLGLAPIQREGMEYEFTTVFDIAMNHEAASSKDRTGLFADKIFKITEATGEIFAKWLAGGIVATTPKEVVKTAVVLQKDKKPNRMESLMESGKKQGWIRSELAAYAKEKFNVTNTIGLQPVQYDHFLETVSKMSYTEAKKVLDFANQPEPAEMK